MHCSKALSVTVTVSPWASPLRTTISRVERAARASPLAKLAMAERASGGMST